MNFGSEIQIFDETPGIQTTLGVDGIAFPAGVNGGVPGTDQVMEAYFIETCWLVSSKSVMLTDTKICQTFCKMLYVRYQNS